MASMLFFLAILPALTSAWVKEMENKGLYQGDMVLSPEQMEQVKKGEYTFGSVKDNLWPTTILTSLLTHCGTSHKQDELSWRPSRSTRSTRVCGSNLALGRRTTCTSILEEDVHRGLECTWGGIGCHLERGVGQGVQQSMK